MGLTSVVYLCRKETGCMQAVERAFFQMSPESAGRITDEVVVVAIIVRSARRDPSRQPD